MSEGRVVDRTGLGIAVCNRALGRTCEKCEKKKKSVIKEKRR